MTGAKQPSLDHGEAPRKQQSAALTFLRGSVNTNSHLPSDFLFSHENNPSVKPALSSVLPLTAESSPEGNTNLILWKRKLQPQLLFSIRKKNNKDKHGKKNS
jgi:hypothetical protein